MCNSMYVGANICVFYWHKVSSNFYTKKLINIQYLSIRDLCQMYDWCVIAVITQTTWHALSLYSKKTFHSLCDLFSKKVNYYSSMLQFSLNKLDFECGSLRYVLRIDQLKNYKLDVPLKKKKSINKVWKVLKKSIQ